jgi:hypothetical protein
MLDIFLPDTEAKITAGKMSVVNWMLDLILFGETVSILKFSQLML